MHNSIIKHIDKRIKKTAGIEIIIEQEQKYTFYVTEIKQFQENIEIENKFSETDLDLFISSLDSRSEIIVSIDGKGVLHKKVSILENSTEIILEDIAHEIFPGIMIQDFYIQHFRTDSNENYLSLIRKELFHSILNFLSKSNINFVNILLGPFSIYGLWQITKFDTLETNLFSFQFPYNKLNISNSDGKAHMNALGDDSIEHTQTVSYANALLRYNSNFYLENSFQEIIEKSKQEFFYKLVSKPVLFTLLLTLLSILIVNYLVQSKVREDISKLSFQFKKHEKQIKEINLLEENIKLKEQFIQENNLSRTSKLTLYIDRIAKLRPNGVTFQKLHIFPRSDFNQEIKALSDFNNKTIYLLGEGDSEEIEEYLILLRKEEWIESVEMNHYENINKTNKGSFKVIIKVVI